MCQTVINVRYLKWKVTPINLEQTSLSCNTKASRRSRHRGMEKQGATGYCSVVSPHWMCQICETSFAGSKWRILYVNWAKSVTASSNECVLERVHVSSVDAGLRVKVASHISSFKFQCSQVSPVAAYNWTRSEL